MTIGAMIITRRTKAVRKRQAHTRKFSPVVHMIHNNTKSNVGTITSESKIPLA